MVNDPLDASENPVDNCDDHKITKSNYTKNTEQLVCVAQTKIVYNGSGRSTKFNKNQSNDNNFDWKSIENIHTNVDVIIK